MVKNNKNKNSSNYLVFGQWPQTKISHAIITKPIIFKNLLQKTGRKLPSCWRVSTAWGPSENTRWTVASSSAEPNWWVASTFSTAKCQLISSWIGLAAIVVIALKFATMTQIWILGGGKRSSEVAFAPLIQQPRVRFLAFPKIVQRKNYVVKN